MGIFELFSKRQKKLRGEMPDVYVYDNIPNTLRVQIVQILKDTLGSREDYKDMYYSSYRHPLLREAFDDINKILCREYGVFTLTERRYDCVVDQLYDYFLAEEDNEKCIDFIELTFKCIDMVARAYEYQKNNDADKLIDDAIIELNQRFKEHGVGYEYKSKEIIRIDSQYIHSKAVIPVLNLLVEKEYEVPNTEFLKAHEHYRHQQYKDAITWALKSFESTMKVICAKRKWAYNQNDTAKKLIDICFQNELVAPYLQSHFTSLQNMLTSGIPVIRNKTGGHGDGTEYIEVPSHLVEYCLHVTASTLLFIIEAENKLGK